MNLIWRQAWKHFLDTDLRAQTCLTVVFNRPAQLQPHYPASGSGHKEAMPSILILLTKLCLSSGRRPSINMRPGSDSNNQISWVKITLCLLCRQDKELVCFIFWFSEVKQWHRYLAVHAAASFHGVALLSHSLSISFQQVWAFWRKWAAVSPTKILIMTWSQKSDDCWERQALSPGCQVTSDPSWQHLKVLGSSERDGVWQLIPLAQIHQMIW